MKLEDEVCSLDLAKKLKELGVKQESLFQHVNNPIGHAGWQMWFQGRVATVLGERAEWYAAFTVAELGEILPPTIDGKYNDKTRWFNSRKTSKACVWYENARPNEEIMTEADTEADARAKMLVYLIENQLVGVKSFG